MSSINRYEILLARTKKRNPRFNIRERDQSWLRPIFWLIGKITRRDYSSFSTTVFSTLYVGSTFASKSPDSKYRLLRHELVHTEQFFCWPLGRWAWPVNHFLTALLYLLVLPVILTFRAKFERAGYTQTLLVEKELRGVITEDRLERNARWLAKTFGGSTYLFMWRRKAAYEWAMETQRKINAGEITNDRDRVDELQAA